MKATDMHFNKWMGKVTMVHPDIGILFSIKKNLAIKPLQHTAAP